SLLAAACSAGAEEAIREPTSAPSDASRISSEGAPGDEFPAEVVNSWGVTSVEGYLDIDRRQTTDEPYDPPAGVLRMTTLMSMVSLPLDGRVRESQAIVVGTVVAISNPHYNSVDGGFWHEPTYARRSILQDVTIEVERVLGDTAELTGAGGAQKELIVVTIWGGQIVVTFDESLDPESLPENVEPGDMYVERVIPNVEVAEGDRVLVFLSMQMMPWFGAPMNSEMPWAQKPVEPCSDQPVGTKVIVYGVWHHLGAADQHITVTERAVTLEELAALAPEAQDTAFAERAVTFAELEAMADASLGQSLEDPSAPLGIGNGSPSVDDHPPPLCYTRHPPPPPDEPSHHPGYED
ncbi:MAG: hypothetical protein IIC88_07640, partial [Chloroflexi bacterium]|nr:hypothetical protein [Chloroflexota bacterium]